MIYDSYIAEGAMIRQLNLVDIYWYHQSTMSMNINYGKVSNIRRTLVGNEIVDHSDVVGASPVGAAPTTSSFST